MDSEHFAGEGPFIEHNKADDTLMYSIAEAKMCLKNLRLDALLVAACQSAAGEMKAGEPYKGLIGNFTQLFCKLEWPNEYCGH